MTSSEYQGQQLSELDMVEEILDDWRDRVEDGETVTFVSAFRGYYDNLMDDLHDSRGDKEHQDGLLERMAICERIMSDIQLVPKYDEAEKAVETEWSSELGEGDVR